MVIFMVNYTNATNTNLIGVKSDINANLRFHVVGYDYIENVYALWFYNPNQVNKAYHITVNLNELTNHIKNPTEIVAIYPELASL